LRLSTGEESPSIAAKRGLEPKQLSGQVRVELDWIVMKALEKDRNRRYATANDLAMDLQRYQEDQPVAAGPPSALYRLRKFVRRHPARLALAMVSTVAALALVGFIIAQSYNVRLTASNAQLAETSGQLDEALRTAKMEKAKACHYLYVSQM